MGNISTSKQFDVIAVSRHERHAGEHMMLLVGEPNQIKKSTPFLPDAKGVFYVDFKDLCEEVFHAVNPDLVMSEAICQTFDCLELAQFLAQAEFSGKYRVTSDDIPHPEIIRREVRNLHPKLDFDVVYPKMPDPLMRLN